MLTIKKAFIFAAGNGTRIHRYSSGMPKSLLQIGEESLLIRNIRLLDKSFKLESITILTGQFEEKVQVELEKLQKTRCKILTLNLSPEQISKGLLTGFAAINKFLKPNEIFLSVLADEYYSELDYTEFSNWLKFQNNFSSVCTYQAFSQPSEYFKNYSVELEGSGPIIKRVVEKPKKINSEYFGLGLIATKKSFAVRAAKAILNGDKVTLIDLLNVEKDVTGEALLGFQLHGYYKNINTVSDYYSALAFYRREKQSEFSIDIIIPAWNEVDTISYVIHDFLPYSRNVIVMDNLSTDGTAEIAKKSGAIVFSKKLNGYGDAIKQGLKLSDADILVIVEADGTNRAEDLPKLLSFLINADAVIGTRTYVPYIENDAHMPFILRIGNIIFGLIITVLWWNRESRFSDVGCTYRALWRNSFLKIESQLSSQGPDFSPEMIVELLNNWQRVIEIPIPYHARSMGVSKFSKGLSGSAKTGLIMLKIIIQKRLVSWIKNSIFSFKKF